MFVENAPSVVEAAAKALGLPLTHCFRLALPREDPHCLSEPFAKGGWLGGWVGGGVGGWAGGRRAGGRALLGRGLRMSLRGPAWGCC